MIQRFILVLSLIFFLTRGVFAQNINMQAGVGLGSYKMDQLKSFQEDLVSGIPFPLKTTDDFPPYLRTYIQLFMELNRFQPGINASYQSSGTRSIYSDYSGEYSADQIVNGYEIGLFNNYKLLEFSDSYFYVGVLANCIFSKLEISDKISIIDAESVETKIKGNSIGLTIAGQVGYKYKVQKFQFGIEGGFLVNPTNSKIKSDGQETVLKVNWQGVRASITMGYNFYNK